MNSTENALGESTRSHLKTRSEEKPRVLTPRRLTRFLGKRALITLSTALLSSLMLAAVEVVISAVLQLFLQALGILSPKAQGFPFLEGWQATGLQIALLVFAIAVVRSVAQFSVAQCATQTLEQVNARLRRLVVYEMVLHPEQRIVPASRVNAQVGEIFLKAAYCIYSSTHCIAAGAQALIILAVMAKVAWQQTLIGSVGLALVGWAILRLNQGTRRIAAQVPIEQRVLTEGIERVARNMLLVRALRAEGREHFRFVKAIKTYASHATRSAALGSLASALTPFFGVLLLMATVYVSQQYIDTPGGTLLAFLYMFIRFVQNLATSSQWLSVMNQFTPHLTEAVEYFDGFDPAEVKAAMAEPEPPPAPARLVPGVGEVPLPAVEIERVEFRYPASPRPALQDVSISVPAGSQFAIVGPSGCGKSTLLGLVLGVLKPTAGYVRVGGQAPGDFFRDPKVRVGYVGAEPFLIAGTVLDNLKYSLGFEVSDEDVWKALEEARLFATVRQLPGQLEYVIAEDGSGLSAGQKQRLCLARALLARPHVLVLDEVSANLDEETEAEIAASLHTLRGTATTIIVSHRQGILQHADHVLDLQRGTVTRGAAHPTAPEVASRAEGAPSLGAPRRGDAELPIS